MEPFFTSFTRKHQLAAARAALPERILIWPKGTRPVTLPEHFPKQSLPNLIPSALSILGIECLAIAWTKKCILFKTKCPHVSFGKHGN